MTNLGSRVRRLERIVLERPPAPCELCGAPDGWVAGFVIRDPEGRPLHEELCPGCGVETMGGRAMSPFDPVTGGYRDVLVLPAGSEPLPI